TSHYGYKARAGRRRQSFRSSLDAALSPRWGGVWVTQKRDRPAGSPPAPPGRSRLWAGRREEAAALGRGGEVDAGAERIAVVLEDVLGGQILGEGRLSLSEMREQLENEIFLEIVAPAVRYAAQHAVEERERAWLERHRPVPTV